MESFDTTKKYYKGDIVLLGKKNSSSEKLIASYNYLQKKLQFKESFTDHEKSILSGYLNAISKSCRATRKDVVEIFSKMFNNETLGKLNIESVVLPIIYTKESDSVAREVHSGAVFPILSADNVDFDYFIEVEDYPDELTSNYKVHAASKISFANLNKIKVLSNYLLPLINDLAEDEKVDFLSNLAKAIYLKNNWSNGYQNFVQAKNEDYPKMLKELKKVTKKVKG